MDWYTPMKSKVVEPELDTGKEVVLWERPTEPTLTTLDPAAAQISTWAGDKYYEGFGTTRLFVRDYWTLRARSEQLFTENIYARGLIRRLVTNEITSGLELEAIPDNDVLGLSADMLAEWSENIESRFKIWAKNPSLCDFYGRRTFGALQRQARRESLIGGDVLVVLYQSDIGLPQIRLINGSAVCTPLNETYKGNDILYGIERDKDGRHVAYWVLEDSGEYKRIPAFGLHTKRRVAWLLYGTELRLDEVRGEPLLGILLQSIKELDRYRDAALRKATINSILAMFIKKTQNQMGTLPMQGGAIKKTTVSSTSTPRRFNITQHIPGMVIEELQVGEEPIPYSNKGTDVNFSVFEDAISHACAWVSEMPPTIYKLMFSSNYSATQGEVNEFKLYLNNKRISFGEYFNELIYIEWLLSEALSNRIVGDDLLNAWRDPYQYDRWGAWIMSEWTGAIKPSADINKQIKAHETLVDRGWSTNDRAARELTGTKYTKNLKRLAREEQIKRELGFVEIEEN